MKRIAILCASGLGDGLLMMIVAHQLKKRGDASTIFHDSAEDLALLFEGHSFERYPPIEKLKSALETFDAVVMENDHSERAYSLSKLRDQKALPQLTFLFPTPSKNHREGDFLFNPHLPVASNLADACVHLFGVPYNKENGLTLPTGTFRKHPQRVVIHPTSKDPKRNWRKEQFLFLSARLEKRGYSPVFCVAPSERHAWSALEGVELPHFPSLKELGAYIYESGFLIGNDSGLGHLASNLGIPTLTISGNPKRVRLWRPDWALGKVTTLLFPLPNFKGIHCAMRDHYWHHFVSVSRTLKTFLELTDESRRHLL